MTKEVVRRWRDFADLHFIPLEFFPVRWPTYAFLFCWAMSGARLAQDLPGELSSLYSNRISRISPVSSELVGTRPGINGRHSWPQT